MSQLAALELPSTQLLVFGLVRRDAKNLAAALNDQGYDAWTLLSLAAASAQVPSVLLYDPTLTSRAPVRDRTAQRAEWRDFYDAFTQKSAAEALHATRLNARLIGYGGLPGAAEAPYAEAHLDDVLDEAEDQQLSARQLKRRELGHRQVAAQLRSGSSSRRLWFC
jgi:hypothetical protein